MNTLGFRGLRGFFKQLQSLVRRATDAPPGSQHPERPSFLLDFLHVESGQRHRLPQGRLGDGSVVFDHGAAAADIGVNDASHAPERREDRARRMD